MNSRLKSGNYEEYDACLNEIVSWISGFGIRVSPTRVGEYRKSFSELLRISKTKDFTTAEHRVDEFLNTLYEFHELQEIYNGFRDKELNEYVKPRLEKIVSGPSSYQNEQNKKSEARNYALELLIASRLSQGGIFVPPLNASDATCKIDGREIIFECKRPQFATTVDKNIKRACKQLKSRYLNSISFLSRGIVGVDISKSFNPSFQKLRYSNEQDITQFMGKVIASFESEYLKTLHSIKEKRTIAVLVRFSALALPIENGGRISYCQQYGLLVLPGVSGVDAGLANKLGLRIKN